MKRFDILIIFFYLMYTYQESEKIITVNPSILSSSYFKISKITVRK